MPKVLGQLRQGLLAASRCSSLVRESILAHDRISFGLTMGNTLYAYMGGQEAPEMIGAGLEPMLKQEVRLQQLHGTSSAAGDRLPTVAAKRGALCVSPIRRAAAHVACGA